MSYSASGKTEDGKVVEFYAQPQMGYSEVESTTDISIARALAQVIAAEYGGNCSISISGHSNPNRKPEDNWANDMITIQVVKN